MSFCVICKLRWFQAIPWNVSVINCSHEEDFWNTDIQSFSLLLLAAFIRLHVKKEKESWIFYHCLFCKQFRFCDSVHSYVFTLVCLARLNLHAHTWEKSLIISGIAIGLFLSKRKENTAATLVCCSNIWLLLMCGKLTDDACKQIVNV